MTESVLTGIGIGIAGIISGYAIYCWQKYKEDKMKARMFDIEVHEKEAHDKIDSLDPDILIDEVNRNMGPKSDK